MAAYYNEIDPFAAAWLRELIKRGLIADGVVDERSIVDVAPENVREFTQCHFFAGIGGWSYALRLAGWPDDRPIWTGSCPCQPFSTAGRRQGFNDDRHLWPHFFRLIRECRPPVVIGEQVASAAGSGLQKMSFGETALRVSGEWERRLEMGVQAMYGSDALSESRKGARVCPSVPIDAPSAGFSSPREAPGDAEGVGVQFRPIHRSDTTAHRQGYLRVDRATFQSNGGQNLGQPFSGQDSAGEGVCNTEHPRSLPCGQQCYGRLGGAENYRFGEGDISEAYRDVQYIIKKTCREIEAQNCRTWLDLVQFDLERIGYACGACNSPASGFGAPHIRQRLYWMAHTSNARPQGLRPCKEGLCHLGEGSSVDGLGDDNNPRLEGLSGDDGDQAGWQEPVGQTSDTGYVADSTMPTNGFWRSPDWLWCRDKKWRPFIPSIPLLVDGIPCALGYDCNEYRCEEAVVNACVPILRQIFGTQEVSQWGFRMLDKFQQEEILQPNMYGTCDGKGRMQMCSPQPGESTFAYSETMRFMWGDREVTCASFERRPYRQYPVQFDDLVPFLPPKGAFTKFFGCKWTAKALQILWEALCEKWPMLHTSGAFAPFWASLSEEDKNRLRVALSARSWRALSTSPTWYVGAFARKRNISQRLKGYGNAIVAPQAAEIIKAFMEVCDD